MFDLARLLLIFSFFCDVSDLCFLCTKSLDYQEQFCYRSRENNMYIVYVSQLWSTFYHQYVIKCFQQILLPSF